MNFKIPFGGRAHKYTSEEESVVLDVMRNGKTLTQGSYLNAFELKFAKYLDVEFAFATNNATSALEMAAQLCQFENDDEIIIPAHTFTSSAYPFARHGAKVVWADIDRDTRVVTLETLKKCISSKTKAIVVVHLYGFCVDMGEIIDFAKLHNILIIEDVAQALGTEVDGVKAGAFGDMSVFSFHSHKNISTLGEGGMLIVKNKALAEIIPMLRHNGHCTFDFERKNYWTPAMGNLEFPILNSKTLWPNNYCLGEVECALGAKLLDRLDQLNNEKRIRANKFIDALSSYPQLKFHKVESMRHNYHLLVAECFFEIRDEFILQMAEKFGIQCVVQYYPLYRYKFYQNIGLEKADCPNTDYFFDNMISFPFEHQISDDDLAYIVDSTKKVLEELS